MPEDGFAEDVQDPFIWLYNECIARTPSTAGASLCPWDNEYDPGRHDVSPSKKASEKREFKQWLADSEYVGRWRSTDDYRSLGRHSQAAFRSQAKAIFRHVLKQLAPNDADVVWEDMIDDETRKPTRTKDG